MERKMRSTAAFIVGEKWANKLVTTGTLTGQENKRLLFLWNNSEIKGKSPFRDWIKIEYNGVKLYQFNALGLMKPSSFDEWMRLLFDQNIKSKLEMVAEIMVKAYCNKYGTQITYGNVIDWVVSNYTWRTWQGRRNELEVLKKYNEMGNCYIADLKMDRKAVDIIIEKESDPKLIYIQVKSASFITEVSRHKDYIPRLIKTAKTDNATPWIVVVTLEGKVEQYDAIELWNKTKVKWKNNKIEELKRRKINE